LSASIHERTSLAEEVEGRNYMLQLGEEEAATGQEEEEEEELESGNPL
jgi:hypothetical protein